jgi:hypothetical protein
MIFFKTTKTSLSEYIIIEFILIMISFKFIYITPQYYSFNKFRQNLL